MASGWQSSAYNNSDAAPTGAGCSAKAAIRVAPPGVAQAPMLTPKSPSVIVMPVSVRDRLSPISGEVEDRRVDVEQVA